MPDAPDIVLCSKLCRHNPTDPNPEYKTTNDIKNMAESVEAFEFKETLKDLSKNGKQIDLKPEQGAATKNSKKIGGPDGVQNGSTFCTGGRCKT